MRRAVRSLEQGRDSLLWEDPSGARGEIGLAGDDDRVWKLAAVLRRGMSAEEVSLETGIDPWFTRAMARIVAMERQLRRRSVPGELFVDRGQGSGLLCRIVN